MSEVKVNKITPRTNCGTTTLGDSGDTINIPAGVTISNNGTATGFGATGAVNWDVSSIKTVTFTATAGVGYFVDTATTGAVTVNLPAGTAGDVIGVADYAQNFASANCTIAPNGTEKIGGDVIDSILDTNGLAATLVYVDASKGWVVTDSGLASDVPGPAYIAATGGCITTCGNYKIHTFNSPGTFCVSTVGNSAGSNEVSYLVVAGGGSAGNNYGGGGGGGGFREGKSPQCSYTASPIACTSGTNNGLPVSASPGAYAIVVGGGGTATTPSNTGHKGTDSSLSTITSTGGGFGGGNGGDNGGPGGSGGGSSNSPSSGGTGNDPSVSPSQGSTGETSPLTNAAGGGGGAGEVGGTNGQAYGGDGAPTAINGSATFYAGGGGGYSNAAGGDTQPGGQGGGGGGPSSPTSGAGGINTGGGSAYSNCGANNFAGGSGIVIIRYKYQ